MKAQEELKGQLVLVGLDVENTRGDVAEVKHFAHYCHISTFHAKLKFVGLS